MHIKEISIDGFKSYANYTKIENFDKYFNAITGLNGSGKSNILDSICFLLGISNLSNVRASSLQELVYKNGQAGVTKATVSIIFDNTNKSQSPAGMEIHKEITVTRQIVIGGKNKYLINGISAQNNRVADMFRSVRLNVNNPHFLIMQGRVTKVMNMKPPEILAMIEEATGTSMYEHKKQGAQNMIKKKDVKLNYFNTTLKEELEPTLNRLRKEKSQFLSYQKAKRELDRCQKYFYALEYKNTREMYQKCDEKIIKLKNKVETYSKQTHEFESEIAIVTERNKDYIKEEEEGKALKEKLMSEITEMKKNSGRITASLKNKLDDLEATKRQLEFHQKNGEEYENNLKERRKLFEEKAVAFEEAEKKFKNEEKRLEMSKKNFQALSLGLALADNGEQSSWKEQLGKTKDTISEINIFIKQNKLKMKHEDNQLKKKSQELKRIGKTNSTEQKQLAVAEEKLKELMNKISEISYTDNQLEQLSDQKRNLMSTIGQLEMTMSKLHRECPGLNFTYRDPEPNFNRESVFGLVVNSFELSDLKYSRALEVGAGGRLFNVIVDLADTASKLLKNNCLNRRCTMIPLDKISTNTISRSVVNYAKSLVGSDHVDLALDLISFEKQVSSAMKFCFGGFFVCQTIDDATKVAFHPKIRRRAVTLSGEVVEPGGSLSGGSLSKIAPITLVARSRDDQKKLAQSQMDLSKLERQLVDCQQKQSAYRKVNVKKKEVENEVEALQTRLANSEEGVLRREVEELTSSKDRLRDLLESSEKQISEETAKMKELERKIADAPAERERELKAAEQEVAQATKVLEKIESKFNAQREERNMMQLQIEQLEKEEESRGDKMSRLQNIIKEKQQIVDELTLANNSESEKVAEFEEKFAHQGELLEDLNKKIFSNLKRKENLSKRISKMSDESQEMAVIIKELQAKKNQSKEEFEKLENESSWLTRERERFGDPGAYDFSEKTVAEQTGRQEDLKMQVRDLEKTVNLRAMNMLEQCEEKSSELMKKKAIVTNDRASLQNTIEELDDSKNKALTEACAKVNENFASIFSTLLPGATAKLCPLEGCSVLEGLEFHVGFGKVWKTNLNELSGGQRSLVALSLILALLLLKPAPIYILDEVDAALDLSHTQNIGRMLKKHFKHSQFIVVSLKDGMFTNANVIFRTKFSDGVSSISRQDNVC